VICDRRSPFEMTPPSDEWAVILLSFAWLRHLRAADSSITRANARSLIEDWINLQGAWHPLGWRLDILSRRVVCWLSQAPFVLEDADARFYRRFIRSLSRQARYLRRALKQSRDGLPRLQALIALNYACLCMQGQSGLLRASARKLIAAFRRVSVEAMITTRSRRNSKSRGSTAMPSRSGISTSSTTTSGLSRSNSRRASTPLRRLATTSRSRSAAIHRENIARTTTASSTIITRRRERTASAVGNGTATFM